MSRTWVHRGAVFLLPLVVLSLAVLAPTQAQSPAAKKYTLLVGVRSYEHRKLGDLKFTENDAEGMASVLAAARYDEIVVLTTARGEKQAAHRPTKANIERELARLLAKVTKHDLVLIGLAGHGVQYEVKRDGKGKNESFFCPADAKLIDSDDFAELAKSMLPFRDLFKRLDDNGAGSRLLLIDACRNDPGGARNVDTNAMPRPTNGTAALFSCRSGERAFETEKLGHGVFFHHVIEGLKGRAQNKRGVVTWNSLSDHVTDRVSDEVPTLIGNGAKQTPHEIKDLEGKSPVLVTLGEEPAVVPKASEGKTSWAWLALAGVAVPAAAIAGAVLLRRRNANVARPVMQMVPQVEANPMPPAPIQPAKQASPPPSAPAQPKQPVQRPTLKSLAKRKPRITNSIGMTFVLIPPGKFLMGSPKDEKDRKSNETQHEVTITKPFYLGVFTVTQKQWRDVMGTDPSWFCAAGGGKDMVQRMNTDEFPVEEVSWEEVQTFLKKLNALAGENETGREYRLPTEAEWEYACRGGASSSTPFYFGQTLTSAHANFKNELGRTCAGGSYAPNAFGLHDVHGNVWEWCADWYGDYPTGPVTDPSGPSRGSVRVYRGGSWGRTARSCRSAVRVGSSPEYRLNDLGFRVALVPART